MFTVLLTKHSVIMTINQGNIKNIKDNSRKQEIMNVSNEERGGICLTTWIIEFKFKCNIARYPFSQTKRKENENSHARIAARPPRNRRSVYGDPLFFASRAICETCRGLQ